MCPHQVLCRQVLGNVPDQQRPGQSQAGIFEVEILGELLHQQDGDGEQQEGQHGVDVEVGGPDHESQH